MKDWMAHMFACQSATRLEVYIFVNMYKANVRELQIAMTNHFYNKIDSSPPRNSICLHLNNVLHILCCITRITIKLTFICK
jgi:hypothetical protein